jgi:hypothetical protein
MSPQVLTPMEDFRRKVARWSRRLRAQPRAVMVMPMTRKWASCSSRGRVCFARDLLGLPSSLQDYVIAHELLHLRHPNHGRVFHALLAAHIPKWRQRHSSLTILWARSYQ